MTRKLLIAILVLLLLTVVGGTAAQDDAPIRIGLLTDQSGWLSVYGYEVEYGFSLGLLYAAGIDPMDYDSVEDALADVTVAGRPVEIIVYDYGSENPAADADNAAAGARELIESELVDIIYGVPNSGAAVQVQEIMSPDNFDLIYMAGPSAAPAITGALFNPNTFRVCRQTEQDALAFATVADQFGEAYIQIAVDTEFGRGTAQAFQDSLTANGAKFADDIIYVPSDATDLTQYIQQIIDSGADVVNPIFAGGLTALWAQQSVELNLFGPDTGRSMVSGTNSIDFMTAAPAIEGGVGYIVYYYDFPENEVNDWLIEQHIAAYQDVPDLFTACSFATAQAVYAGLEITEGDPYPEAMIPALEGLEFDAPKGTIVIRESDHQALVPIYVLTYGPVEEVQVTDDFSMTMQRLILGAEVPKEDAAPPCSLVGDYADRCE